MVNLFIKCYFADHYTWLRFKGFYDQFYNLKVSFACLILKLGILITALVFQI